MHGKRKRYLLYNTEKGDGAYWTKTVMWPEKFTFLINLDQPYDGILKVITILRQHGNYGRWKAKEMANDNLLTSSKSLKQKLEIHYTIWNISLADPGFKTWLSLVIWLPADFAMFQSLWASRFCWVSSLSRFISALSWSAPSSDVTTSGLQLEDCLGCLLISRIVSDSSSSGSGPSLKRQKRNSGHFLRSTQLTPWFLSSSSLVTLK